MKCERNEITCSKYNRKFFGKWCFKNHVKNRSKFEGKTDIVCDTVKKCLDCNRNITGKYVNCHKCGYSECNNCNKYVGKNHKCFIKKGEKLKEDTALSIVRNLAKITTQLKRKICAIHVEPTLRNTYFTILKLPKTQVPTP